MLWEGQSAQEALVFPSGSQGESVDISRIGHMALPVTVKLIDFTRKDYRGTTVAADYQSRLHLTGPGVDRDVVVSMNRPLRLGGYTFFQSSYLQQDGLESTSLTVVANPVRYLPYAASIAICLGLVLHVVMRLVAHIRARGRKA